MARSVSWLWLAPVLLTVGCGSSPETVGQVRDRYRAPMTNLRGQFQTLHGRIPGIANGMAARLDPAPFYSEDGGGNTDFLALEHLQDSDARPSFDLGLGREIETALAWTGSASVDDPTARREAGKDVEETFKHALATRYLVVVRSSRTPVTGQQKMYSGGDVSVEAFVVDLKANLVVASVSAKGAAAGPIQVDLPAGPRRNEHANMLLTTAATAQLKEDLAAKLSAATGGTFTFKKPRGVLAASS
jgi:hypothetical protein